jgi:hypothetical protein
LRSGLRHLHSASVLEDELLHFMEGVPVCVCFWEKAGFL